MSFSEHPIGNVCWLDLGVTDVSSTAAFYSRLFGWTVAEPDESGYRLASLRGRLVAALGPAEDPGPPYWTIYLHTADIAASIKAFTAAGGTVIVPPTPAGDAGVAAVVRHPHSGPLSFWQPGNHTGTYASGRHGTLAGVHLHTHATHPARAFLQVALGWQLHPSGTVTHNGRTVATWATSPLATAHPSPWLVHFHVTNVSATVREALQLGASPIPEAPNILRDPAGALFALTPLTRSR